MNIKNNIISGMPLFANITNAPLIKLSPQSLPFDDIPIENSPNLINSGKIYELHNNFIKLQCGVIQVNNPTKTDFVQIFDEIEGIVAADRIYVKDFKTAIDFINKIKNLGGRTNWTIQLNNGAYGAEERLDINDLSLKILNKNDSYSIDCRLQYKLFLINSYVEISNIHFGGEKNGFTDANINAYYNSAILLTNCKFYAGPTIHWSILINYNSTLTISGNTEFHFPLDTFYDSTNENKWFHAIRIGGGYNAINTINGVTFKGQEDYDYATYKYPTAGITIFGRGFITLNSNKDSNAIPVIFENLHAGIMISMGGYVYSNSKLDFTNNVKIPFAQDHVNIMPINEVNMAGGICIQEKYILLPQPTT